MSPWLLTDVISDVPDQGVAVVGYDFGSDLVGRVDTNVF
jgi:hypothetical protein